MPALHSFFSDAQTELVARVLDRIVPPNDKMPGAGEIAVEHLDRFVAASSQLKRTFNNGLTEIELHAQQSFSGAFASLTGEQQDEVLRQVEAKDSGFFDLLVRQTYNGYYTDPRIIEALGLEPRGPQPRGYRVEMGNISLMENVQRRGRIYRDG